MGIASHFYGKDYFDVMDKELSDEQTCKRTGLILHVQSNFSG